MVFSLFGGAEAGAARKQAKFALNQLMTTPESGIAGVIRQPRSGYWADPTVQAGYGSIEPVFAGDVLIGSDGKSHIVTQEMATEAMKRAAAAGTNITSIGFYSLGKASEDASNAEVDKNQTTAGDVVKTQTDSGTTKASDGSERPEAKTISQAPILEDAVAQQASTDAIRDTQDQKNRTDNIQAGKSGLSDADVLAYSNQILVDAGLRYGKKSKLGKKSEEKKEKLGA